MRAFATGLTGSLCGILALSPGTIAAPFASPSSGWMSLRPGLLRRQEELSALDQNWVKKWAAIGDSYSAGIGAGKSIDYSCSRYDDSYPSMMNRNSRFSGDQEFSYESCSGAVTSGVLKQAQRLSGGQDAITISVGGNDVDFVGLLNHCVYTFFSGGNCDEQMAKTEALIDELPGKLAVVYDEAVSKLSDQGTIYVTGYAHFFDDTTNECDEASLNVWGGVIGVTLGFQQYLTVERRRQMNTLVDKLNDKTTEAINAAVDKHGDKFEQVLYDYYIGEFEGRFCMPGVHEPAPNRPRLMFYLHGIDGEPGEHDDNVNHGDLKVREDGLNPDTRLEPRQFDSPAYPPGSFEAEVFNLLVEGSKHLVDNEGADPNDPQIKRTLAPDFVARVFHPTITGHAVIANKVLHHMARRRARQLGIEEPPEVVEGGSCPLPGRPGSDQSPEDGQKVSLRADGVCITVETAGSNFDQLCPATAGHPNRADRVELATDPSQPEVNTIVYGSFDKTQEFLLKVKPGCKMNAKWPSTENAIFQADGRLYDDDAIVFDHDMTCDPSDDLPVVPNPYARDEPEGTKGQQGKGDNKGKNCGHTNREMFLGAISRFNEHAILTGRTRAVWPIQDDEKVRNDPGQYFETKGDNLFTLKEYTNNRNERNKRGIYVELLCPEGTYMTGFNMARVLIAHYQPGDGCGWVPLENGCTIKADTCDDCSDEGASYALYGNDELPNVSALTGLL